MPPLLSDVAPNERPIFAPKLLGRRSALAALVAETITTWSYVEHALGRSVAAMSRGANAGKMENYIANRQFRRRLEIVRRVANTNMQAPYLETFLKGLDVITELAAHRNSFAHGIWSSVEALPNALLLVAPEHIFRHWGAANDWLAKFIECGPGAVDRFGQFDNRHVEVWSADELREEVNRLNKIYELALALESLANSDPFDASDQKRQHIHGLLLNNSALWP